MYTGPKTYKTISQVKIADLENADLALKSKSPRKAREYKKQLDQQADKAEMGKLLIQELKPISSRFDQNANDIYAWEFDSGIQSVNDGSATEMNIVFLGTGTMPNFSDHQVISAGGDVLCHIALQKAVVAKQPSILFKGVGTLTLHENTDETEQYYDEEKDSYYPVNSLFNPQSEYFGDTSELVLGGGIRQRLKVAMEEFYIPNLINMIINQNINQDTKVEFDINVIGHSRGAITGFYMITAINEWLKAIKNPNTEIDVHTLAQLCKVPVYQLMQAINLLRRGNIDCKINSLSFDPVEGKCRVNDVHNWFTHDTIIPLFVEGLALPLHCNCSSMPENVERADIFLAESERRLDFRPTIPAFNNNTLVSYKVQIGTHSTMIGNIGDDNGTGQDAYRTVKDYAFIQEAALAMVDKNKIDANKFLYGENLPPFQRHMLRRIFRSDSQEASFAYQNTALFLKSFLKENVKSNQDLISFINLQSHSRGKKSYAQMIQLINKNPDLCVRCCEWLMRNDQKFTNRAYFLLEKDIHIMYLNPSDHLKKEQLSQWQKEMKQDTTTIMEGPLSGLKYLALRLQSYEQPREVYLRSGVDQIRKTSLYELCPECKSTNLLAFPIGGKKIHQMTNPFHIVLSDLINARNDNFNENLLDLDIQFSKLNAIIINEAKHPTTSGKSLSSTFINEMYKLFLLLKVCPLNSTQKSAVLGILRQNIEQYQEYNADELDQVISIQLQELNKHNDEKAVDCDSFAQLDEPVVSSEKNSSVLTLFNLSKKISQLSINDSLPVSIAFTRTSPRCH